MDEFVNNQEGIHIDLKELKLFESRGMLILSYIKYYRLQS